MRDRSRTDASLRTAPRVSIVRILLALALATVFALAVRDSRAQEFGRLEGLQSVGAAFRYALVGEPTRRVAVTGDVRAPGVYEVNESFDLATLLAFAGGASVLPEQKEIEQRTTVRLVRGADRAVVYDGLWSDVQTAPSVALVDGDQVVVRLYTRRVTTWRDNIGFVSLGTSVAAVLLQVVILLR